MPFGTRFGPYRGPVALPLLRRKAVSEREAIQAFLKPPREIILPALALQAAPPADLLQRHALDQNVMDERRSVGAELALDAVEPQRGLALALGDRHPRRAAVGIFASGITGLRPALGALPVALKRPAAAILSLVDLPMRMQPRQRIITNRAQGDDFLARLESQGIVNFDRSNFRIARQI